MKIIVDWRIIYDPRGGMYRTFKKILPLLAQQHGCEFGFLRRARKNEAPAAIPAFPFSLPWPLSQLPEGGFKDALWKQKVNFSGADLFHTPYYSVPPTEKIPCLATIYDLIPELFLKPNTGPIFDRLRERKRWLATHSRRLIAISQSTKNDLCRVYEIDPAKVDVVPLGVEGLFLEAPANAETNAVYRKKWGVEGPFLLVVGGRHAHKNFFGFLETFASTGLKNDFKIIASGEPWNKEETAKLQELGISSLVKNLVFPEDIELKALYQACAAFVYPSYYEGFGLPPLEAMACGAPVALAAVSSLPEVMGDSGFYFDPASPGDMAKVIRQAAEAGRQAPRVVSGRARARQFSWEETARLTALTYQKALA